MANITIERISPDEDLTRIAAVQIAAFDPSGEFQNLLEPPPRAPLEVRKKRLAMRLKTKFEKQPGGGEAKYIGYKAVTEEGEIVGACYWRRAGYRTPQLDESKMSKDEKESYAGWDLVRYNNFKQACQGGMDKVLAEKGDTQGCHYLQVLVIHPDHQKKQIGQRMLDHHLAQIDSPESDLASLPAWLESSPAGLKLYESRGFKVEAMMKAEGWEALAPEGFKGCYRPAKQT